MAITECGISLAEAAERLAEYAKILYPPYNMEQMVNMIADYTFELFQKENY